MLFIKNKFRRLLLPFLLTAVFVSIPLKYFSGYWEKSNGLIGDIIIGQLLLQGNTHLWFLPTLFCEMIIFWHYIFKFAYNRTYIGRWRWFSMPWDA